MAGEYNLGKVSMSVCVIKPDAVQGGIMQEILSELEKRGFILLQQDMQMMTTTKARALYLEHEKADFFKSLIGFMTSGPINAVLLTHSSSPDPVTELQGTVGPTNSEKARADAPERCEARLLAALASCMDFPLTDIYVRAWTWDCAVCARCLELMACETLCMRRLTKPPLLMPSRPFSH
jgi:nucleoside-diphosphate kinase